MNRSDSAAVTLPDQVVQQLQRNTRHIHGQNEPRSSGVETKRGDQTPGRATVGISVDEALETGVRLVVLLRSADLNICALTDLLEQADCDGNLRQTGRSVNQRALVAAHAAATTTGENQAEQLRIV
jgi:hypothetical protein